MMDLAQKAFIEAARRFEGPTEIHIRNLMEQVMETGMAPYDFVIWYRAKINSTVEDVFDRAI